MATKVCKLKDGNEIISDIKEIRNKEDEPIAYLLTSPYRVEHFSMKMITSVVKTWTKMKWRMMAMMDSTKM